MADQTQFASGDVLIVAEDLVVEVFHRVYEKTFRVPTAWVGVHVKPARHDELEVRYGIADDPGQPMYGEGVELYSTAIEFHVPMADEPQLREFFGAVATRAGRPA